MQRSYDVLIIFALPLVFGTLFLSPAIIGLLGGSQYPESARILNILIVAVGVIFLSALFSYSLIALEQQKKLLWISLSGAIFNMAFNIILIPRYSYWAAAASTLMTEVMVTILMMAAVWQTIRFLPSFKIGLKATAASIVMSAFLWFFHSVNFFVLLVAAIAIYFGFMFLVRGISVGEIKGLLKKGV